MVDGDEARIAVGGGAAGLGAVEQGDGVALALQGAGGRGADDAGANDDDGILVVHARDVSTVREGVSGLAIDLLP